MKLIILMVSRSCYVYISPLFDKILDHFDISIDRGLMKCSKSVRIGIIDNIFITKCQNTLDFLIIRCLTCWQKYCTCLKIQTTRTSGSIGRACIILFRKRSFLRFSFINFYLHWLISELIHWSSCSCRFSLPDSCLEWSISSRILIFSTDCPLLTNN